MLLHFKAEMHGFVGRFDNHELRAIMQLVLLALVVLPGAARHHHRPLQRLQPPRDVADGRAHRGARGWSATSRSSSAARSAGILAGGVFGGLISSTATTVSWARRTQGKGDLTRASMIVILIASTVVYARVLVEIAAVARPFLPRRRPPSSCSPPPWPWPRPDSG